MPWAICHVPLAIPEQFLQCGRAHCSLRGPLPLGNAVAMSGCTWSATVFGWVAYVKWHPHKWQETRFLSRTLHCNDMINGIVCGVSNRFLSVYAISNSPLHVVSVGQGHLETRSDGGDCNVDTTEAVGTGRLKSFPNCDLATKPRSHQAAMSWTDQSSLLCCWTALSVFYLT